MCHIPHEHTCWLSLPCFQVLLPFVKDSKQGDTFKEKLCQRFEALQVRDRSCGPLVCPDSMWCLVDFGWVVEGCSQAMHAAHSTVFKCHFLHVQEAKAATAADFAAAAAAAAAACAPASGSEEAGGSDAAASGALQVGAEPAASAAAGAGAAAAAGGAGGPRQEVEQQQRQQHATVAAAAAGPVRIKPEPGTEQDAVSEAFTAAEEAQPSGSVMAGSVLTGPGHGPGMAIPTLSGTTTFITAASQQGTVIPSHIQMPSHIPGLSYLGDAGGAEVAGPAAAVAGAAGQGSMGTACLGEIEAAAAGVPTLSSAQGPTASQAAEAAGGTSAAADAGAMGACAVPGGVQPDKGTAEGIAGGDVKAEWRALAFCLREMGYSEKSFRRVVELLRCYKHALADKDVYASFYVSPIFCVLFSSCTRLHGAGQALCMLHAPAKLVVFGVGASLILPAWSTSSAALNDSPFRTTPSTGAGRPCAQAWRQEG